MDKNNEDKIAKLFNLMDIDNEGGIPKTKLKEILQKSVGDKFSEEEFEKLVEEMNLVENGNISLMSFMGAILSRENVANIPVDFDQLENLFKTINRENNGLVGVQGWQNILTNLGINLSEAEVSEVMTIACGIMKQVGGIDIAGLYGGAQTALPDEDDDALKPVDDISTDEEKDVAKVENKTCDESESTEPKIDDDSE